MGWALKPFTFVTWNVLATSYMHRGNYPYTDRRHFDPAWRHPAVARRARELDADILCLQEVEPVVMALLRDELAADYVGVHAMKEHKPDGCAIFVRNARFLRVSERHEIYSDASGHVAQIVVVEDLETKTRIVILNTHFKWQAPKTALEKRHGEREAADVVNWLAHEEETPNQIVAGDLNAAADSETIQSLRAAGFHDAHAGLNFFTANSNEIAKRIDYIFTRGALVATPRVPPPITNVTPLPSDREPSDHLALIATLSL